MRSDKNRTVKVSGEQVQTELEHGIHTQREMNGIVDRLFTKNIFKLPCFFK